eukprot:TRINITY_DN7609_c0_g3_i1.p1 TRINITY_DN7609_c0_g3~~TRINITY_DN7609_c0_g3_i1.p1  ORF type:complete len:740 (+),score=143.62 TRINITY_DN7609_c0_g3_i1:116-2335(+)
MPERDGPRDTPPRADRVLKEDRDRREHRHGFDHRERDAPDWRERRAPRHSDRDRDRGWRRDSRDRRDRDRRERDWRDRRDRERRPREDRSRWEARRDNLPPVPDMEGEGTIAVNQGQMYVHLRISDGAPHLVVHPQAPERAGLLHGDIVTVAYSAQRHVRSLWLRAPAAALRPAARVAEDVATLPMVCYPKGTRVLLGSEATVAASCRGWASTHLPARHDAALQCGEVVATEWVPESGFRMLPAPGQWEWSPSRREGGVPCAFCGERARLCIQLDRGGAAIWVGGSAVVGPAPEADWFVSPAAIARHSERRRAHGGAPASLIPDDAYPRALEALIAGTVPAGVLDSAEARARRTEMEVGRSLQNPGKAIKLIHKAGEGTYGEVHRGVFDATKTSCAVKRLRDEVDGEKERERRRGILGTSLREISVLALLQGECRHIVRLLHTVMGSNHHLYAAFEWVANDLAGVVAQANEGGGLHGGTIRNLMRQVLTACEFLHSHGFIHRDIKPSNILLGDDGVLRLCDFGFINKATAHAHTPNICTPTYRPPEVMFGTRDHAGSIDVWGVGCILYKMETGRSLMSKQTDLDNLGIMMDILGAPVPEGHMAVAWPELFSATAAVRFAHFDVKLLRDVKYQSRRLPLLINRMVDPTAAPDVLDLLTQMLTWDPLQRLTAADALRAPYFTRDPTLITADDELLVAGDQEGTTGLQLRKGGVLELANLHVYILRNPKAKFEKNIGSGGNQ